MPHKDPTAKREYQQRYRQEHQERYRKYMLNYYEQHQKEIREKQNQTKAWQRYREKHREEINQKTRENRRSNPTKWRTQNRKYYQEHKTEQQARRREWVKSHPEEVQAIRNNSRAKAHGAVGEITGQDIRDLLELQECKCAMCAKSFPPRGTLMRFDIDHIVPLREGGANTRNNIQLLCRGCNVRRHFALIHARKA